MGSSAAHPPQVTLQPLPGSSGDGDMQEPPLLGAAWEGSLAVQPPAEPLHFPGRTLGPPSSRSPTPLLWAALRGGLPTGLKYSSKFHLFPRGSCSSQVPAWDQWPQALGSEKAQTQSLLDPLLHCCGAFQQTTWVGAEPSKFIAYVPIKVSKPATCGAKLWGFTALCFAKLLWRRGLPPKGLGPRGRQRPCGKAPPRGPGTQPVAAQEPTCTRVAMMGVLGFTRWVVDSHCPGHQHT